MSRSLEDFLTELDNDAAADLQAWGSWAKRCDAGAVHGAARSLVAWSESGQLAARYRELTDRVYVYGKRNGLPRHLDGIVDERHTCGIAGSGHFPMVDHPSALWAAIARALDDGNARDRPRVSGLVPQDTVFVEGARRLAEATAVVLMHRFRASADAGAMISLPRYLQAAVILALMAARLGGGDLIEAQTLFAVIGADLHAIGCSDIDLDDNVGDEAPPRVGAEATRPEGNTTLTRGASTFAPLRPNPRKEART